MGFFVTVVLSGQYACQLEWILSKLAAVVDKNFDSSFWKSQRGGKRILYLDSLIFIFCVCARVYAL